MVYISITLLRQMKSGQELKQDRNVEVRAEAEAIGEVLLIGLCS